MSAFFNQTQLDTGLHLGIQYPAFHPIELAASSSAVSLAMRKN